MGGGYFCKPLDGQCGGGIFKLNIEDGKCQINDVSYTLKDGQQLVRDYLKQDTYVIQELVVQHSILAALYNQSINTMRLITVYDKNKDEVKPIVASLRIGGGGSTTDNWSQNGIMVAIDLSTGKLDKYGFYSPSKGTKILEHPDTHVIFEGYQLPFFEESIKQAKDLHCKLKCIPFIGWDIAFTPTGPLFIEGNDNMGIEGVQTVHGGLKKKFKKPLNS